MCSSLAPAADKLVGGASYLGLGVAPLAPPTAPYWPVWPLVSRQKPPHREGAGHQRGV